MAAQSEAHRPCSRTRTSACIPCRTLQAMPSLRRDPMCSALSGALNVEQCLEQELQLYQFLLTQRPRIRCCVRIFPWKASKRERNVTQAVKTLDRETERSDHPSITVRQTSWWKSTSRSSQNEGHSESQPKFIPYLKSLLCYCRCSGLRCLTRLKAWRNGLHARTASAFSILSTSGRNDQVCGCAVAWAVAGCGEANVISEHNSPTIELHTTDLQQHYVFRAGQDVQREHMC